MKTTIGSLVLFILLFSSCSFEKRIYRNGFYVDRNGQIEIALSRNNFPVVEEEFSLALIKSKAEFKNVKINCNEKLISNSENFKTPEAKISDFTRKPIKSNKDEIRKIGFQRKSVEVRNVYQNVRKRQKLMTRMTR